MLTFTNPTDKIPSSLPAPSPGFKFLYNLWRDGVTLVRAIADEDIKYFFKYLLGAECIYEFGGSSDYYKSLFKGAKNYKVTGMSPGCDDIVNMTAMSLADNSIEANFSAFALEHVSDYKKFIEESFRTLKPGGRILLVVPFIYCHHGAPDDYVRFSRSYLIDLFKDWNVIATTDIGNRTTAIAEMWNEKPWMRLNSTRPQKLLLKVLSSIMTLLYIIKPTRCQSFPSAVLLFAEKPHIKLTVQNEKV
ncbi:MAG: methyltransferase domain-containing protein [Pseudomonadota bacterium]|nr:methyltransferase domain-containing protein [Pseudomonadota bacterium]